MRNKLYWGLGILIVLLIGAFVFVMVNKNAQIKQLEAEAEKAQDKANQMKDTPPVAREGFKMVPHGDHWHEVPIDAPDTWQGEPHEPIVKDAPVTTERLGYYAKIYKKYGVEPPPPGYAYRMSDPGVLRLDGYGKPILYKEGEAVFDIVIGIGFAPTYEQYQHYLHLIQLRDAARHAGDDNRADQLNAEIDQLEADAQGEIPVVSSSQAVPTHLAEEAKVERSRKASQIMKQAYIDMGLGYMIDY